MNRLDKFLYLFYAGSFIFGLIKIAYGVFDEGLYLCIGSILLILFNMSLNSYLNKKDANYTEGEKE